MISATAGNDLYLTFPVHFRPRPSATPEDVAALEARRARKRAAAEAKRQRRAARPQPSAYAAARVGAAGEAEQDRAERCTYGGRPWLQPPVEEEPAGEEIKKLAARPHPTLVARNLLASHAKQRRHATRRRSGAR